MEILIERYVAADLASVASVLGDAFVTNPTHVAAFGPQRLDQNRLFFRIGLEHMFTGDARVALVEPITRASSAIWTSCSTPSAFALARRSAPSQCCEGAGSTYRSCTR